MDTKTIKIAVDELFDEELDFLSELTKLPSKRGQEQEAQNLVSKTMSDMGLKVDSWDIKLDEIRHLPGFSPVLTNYDNARNVVASHIPKIQKGHSLILNGHIDVVPEGAQDMWQNPPFSGHIDNGWLYGRGAGDMKAGLVANIYALKALQKLKVNPAAPVFLQSVVEEECTGNGTLACLARGYKADAALIPEPFSEKLVISQVGVIWFQVALQGLPTHVAYSGEGQNAIEAAIPIIAALHKLEGRWNMPNNRHRDFSQHSHALNLNIGKIKGGDWPSSVPAWCVFDVRMGIFPGQDIKKAREEIEQCIYQVAKENKFLAENQPKIIYHGFQAQGYALSDDSSEQSSKAIATLSSAHQSITGKSLPQIPITATTDSRFFGLYADTPALVYGPHAENIHGFNERVEIESVRRLTQTIAVFISNWCSLENAL